MNKSIFAGWALRTVTLDVFVYCVYGKCEARVSWRRRSINIAGDCQSVEQGSYKYGCLFLFCKSTRTRFRISMIILTSESNFVLGSLRRAVNTHWTKQSRGYGWNRLYSQAWWVPVHLPGRFCVHIFILPRLPNELGHNRLVGSGVSLKPLHGSIVKKCRVSKTGLARDPPLAAFGEVSAPVNFCVTMFNNSQSQAKELAQYFLTMPEEQRPSAIFSSPYCEYYSILSP